MQAHIWYDQASHVSDAATAGTAIAQVGMASCAYLQAMEGHIMLAVLFVAAVNALGHVYSAHRHEEVTRTLAERAWHKLQYDHTQHSLAQMQVCRHHAGAKSMP